MPLSFAQPSASMHIPLMINFRNFSVFPAAKPSSRPPSISSL